MHFYLRVVNDNSLVKAEQDPEVINQVEGGLGCSGFSGPFEVVIEEPECAQVEGKPRCIPPLCFINSLLHY
jgi:hypothetical protein